LIFELLFSLLSVFVSTLLKKILRKMKKFILMFAIAAAGIGTSSYAQLSQNFEGTTGSALPTGWTQHSPGTSTGWVTGANTAFNVGYWGSLGSSTVAPHTRVVGVVDRSTTSVNPADTLFSPSFSLVGNNNAYLSFDGAYGELAIQSGAFESALILVSNNNGPWTVVDSVRGSYTNASPTIKWTTQHVSMSAYNGSSNVRIAFTYTDRGGYIVGCLLDNITVSTPASNDIQLADVSNPISNDPLTAYGPTGSTLSLTGDVNNLGTTAITSFTINYQIGSSPVVSFPISGVNIPLFGTYAFAAGNITLPTTAGNSNVRVWATVTGDVNHLNDSVGAIIVGGYNPANMPTKKLVMEEATGTWCGWCVRGIVYMDSLEELYGNGVSLVAVHNNDPMTVTNYDAWETSFPGFTGFPNAIVDRRELTDPSNLLDVYSAENALYGFANISFGTRTLTGTTLSVPITVTPTFPLNGDYRLVMAVTEDYIHGPAPVLASGTWAQHNYYSHIDAPTYNGGPLSGQGINYVDSGVALTNVGFAHVARTIMPSVTGSSNLPATMAVGTGYTATITATITSTWRQPFIKLVAMLLRGSDGVVLNSNNTTLWNTGVQSVTANVTHAAVYPNPASTQTNVAFELSKASTTQIRVTDMSGREVYATTAKQYAAGTYTVTIPTATMASGIYNVTVITDNGSLTDRLTVVK